MSDAYFESPKANLRLLGYPPRRNLKKKNIQHEDLENKNTKNLNSSLSKMKMGVSSEYPYF